MIAQQEPLLWVVHEDSDLLVVHKPAGLVCHPTKGDASSSLIGRLRIHLANRFPPQLINRLDRETSGLVVVGKSSEAALQLRRLWEQRAVEKKYFAIVHGAVRESQGVIEAPLGKDDQSPVAIKDCVREDGAPAQTQFTRLQSWTNAPGTFSLLQVVPQTGRKHQIRVHLEFAGHPIVGDKLYGGDEKLYLNFVHGLLDDEQKQRLLLPWQALHAAELSFVWREKKWHFRSAPERWFCEFLPPAVHALLLNSTRRCAAGCCSNDADSSESL